MYFAKNIKGPSDKYQIQDGDVHKQGKGYTGDFKGL